MSFNQIDEYTLVRELDKGSMGVVFLATTPAGEQRALKTFFANPETTDAEWEFLRNVIVREGRRMMEISHENIVKVYEVREADDYAYIVMDYIEGTTVARHVQDRGALDPTLACDWLQQAAAALDYSHTRHSLIHRDVKPANMLLTASLTTLKLTDFGIAKRAIGTGQSSFGGTFFSAKSKPGTPNYRSPEQIRNTPDKPDKNRITPRVDQWGLAVTAFYMLTGTLPFETEDLYDLDHRICTEPEPPITSRRPDLPKAMNRVFRKALAKNPAKRYSSCSEFVAQLRLAAAGVTDPKHKRALWIGVGLAAAAGIVLAAMEVQRLTAGRTGRDVDDSRQSVPGSTKPKDPPSLGGGGPGRKVGPSGGDVGSKAASPCEPNPTCYRLAVKIKAGIGGETRDVSEIPGGSWSLSGEPGGSLSTGDIFAQVTSEGSCEAGSARKLTVEWLKDNRHADEATAAVGAANPYPGELVAGKYIAILRLDGKCVQRIPFTLDN